MEHRTGLRSSGIQTNGRKYMNVNTINSFKSIHQFHSGSAYGDGVTNGLFFIQKMLIELGFESKIYVEHIDSKLTDVLEHYPDFQDNADTILIIHHSMGHGWKT
jgi:hypothetical protein